MGFLFEMRSTHYHVVARYGFCDDQKYMASDVPTDPNHNNNLGEMCKNIFVWIYI